MLLLALSLFALAVGPGLAQLSRNRPRLLETIDGFVVATITGIVALHVVPHALAELGARAAVPLVIGLLLPSWLERRRSRPSSRWKIELLLVIGLALHALVDGMALNTHEGHRHSGHVEHDGLLALAVSLHRVPEGLAVWWIVAPKRGPRTGVLALLFVGAASCAGFLLSESLVDRIPQGMLVGFEVLVAGSLLHVIAHHELTSSSTTEHAHEDHSPHVHEGGALASGIGALVGGVFLFTITRQHPVTYRVARVLGFGTTLETLALASAPFLLLSLVVSSVLHTFGAPVYQSLMLPARSRIGAAVREWIAGTLLPICSCGVLSFYRDVSRTIGRPRSETLALLVSAPEMELASVLLSATLIDPWFSLVRPLALSVVGVVAGVALGSPSSTDIPSTLTRTARRVALREGIRFALGETVEHTGPWIVFGLFVAALVEPFVDPGAIRSVPLPLLVTVLAIVGAFVPTCASGVTPLLAVLIHKGISPGALLAFLIMAAAGNARVLRLLARVHSRAFAVRYASLLMVFALAFGSLGSVVWSRGLDTPLHGAASAGGGTAGWVSLGLLVLLFAAAVLRRGPRRLLLELVAVHA
jgi:uncharacterized membrane protein YraQ (UPF0718 family)